MSTTMNSHDVPTSDRSAGSRRAPVWLAIIVLLVAGFLAGMLVGRITKGSPAPPADLAAPAVSAMVDQQIDAVNSGDPARIAPFYAEQATFTEINDRSAVPIKGAAEIARVMAGNVKLFGPFLHKPGTVLQKGNFVAYAGSWGDITGGVVVYELDSKGKILNQWALHIAEE